MKMDVFRFGVIALVAAAVILNGCAGAPRTDTPTGGTDFIMYVRDGTGAEAHYEVGRDGSLAFGGGMAACIGKITWTGTLTAEELEQFRSLLQAQNWFDRKPASTGQPPTQMYRITINSPEVRRAFKVKGESPELEAIRELLARAALRRLEDDLRALPQPGPQRR